MFEATERFCGTFRHAGNKGRAEGGVVWSAAGGANMLQHYHSLSGYKMMSLVRE